MRPHGLQHTWFPCPSPTPGAYSNSCPLSQWCHPTISPTVIPYPVFSLFRHQGLFWLSSSHQVAKLLELQLQCHSLQWIFRIDFLSDWLVWCPCSIRDSQELSPTLQFKSINSSALSLLYGTSLTLMKTSRKAYFWL